MKIKSERDFWSGLMFVAVGVIFAIGATNYSMGPACPANDPCAANLWARMSQLSAHPGAGYFPLGLAILLAILGAFVLFKSLTIESEGGDPVGAFAWRPLLIIVAAIAVFGADARADRPRPDGAGADRHHQPGRRRVPLEGRARSTRSS